MPSSSLATDLDPASPLAPVVPLASAARLRAPAAPLASVTVLPTANRRTRRRRTRPVAVRRSSQLRPDAGMATAEYAIATLAACGFAGLLLAVLTSDSIRALLVAIIQRALTLA